MIMTDVTGDSKDMLIRYMEENSIEYVDQDPFDAYVNRAIADCAEDSDYSLDFLDKHIDAIGNSIYEKIDSGMITDDEFYRDIDAEVTKQLTAYEVLQSEQVEELKNLRECVLQGMVECTHRSVIKEYYESQNFILIRSVQSGRFGYAHKELGTLSDEVIEEGI